MQDRGRQLAGLLVAVVVLAGCARGAADPAPPAPSGPASPPAAGPEASSPSPPGSPPDDELPGAVRQALAEVERGDAPLTAIAVARGGVVRGEAHAPGRDPAAPQPVWSVTKSVVSALVGIAADEGLLSLGRR